MYRRLKTVSLVVKHSQSAEALVKSYESKLYEEDAMTSDPKSIEAVILTLKVVYIYSSIYLFAFIRIVKVNALINAIINVISSLIS